jgi:tetratricopeptide (TPR) repeat protein
MAPSVRTKQVNLDLDGRSKRGRELGSFTYQIPLHSRVSLLIFFFVLAIPASFLVLETTRAVLAQIWASSLNPEVLRRAIALDPSNPELHFTLGRILLLKAEPVTQGMAEEEFRKAISMNPHSAIYWSGLGKACYSSGNQPCANAAFGRAQELAPNKPEVAWEVAVNDVVSDQPQSAVGHLRTFLRLQPDGLDQTFQLLMRGFGDPNLIWRDLLSAAADPASKLRFLDYLAANSDFERAGTYWAQLTAEKTAFPVAAAIPYLEKLLATGHYREAAGVWAYTVRQNGLDEQIGSDRSNLVFNGGFEQKPLNAGFDWRFAQQPYLTVDFSDATAHTGARSFRADFTVPQNSEYEPAYQLVPVVPGQTYELSAYVKSEAITSDSGPRLRVLDPKCPGCLDTATQGTSGTTDWHQVTTQFTAGPTTELIRLSVWRPRGRSYPMEISGKVWFDDISLHPIPVLNSSAPR